MPTMQSECESSRHLPGLTYLTLSAAHCVREFNQRPKPQATSGIQLKIAPNMVTAWPNHHPCRPCGAAPSPLKHFPSSSLNRGRKSDNYARSKCRGKKSQNCKQLTPRLLSSPPTHYLSLSCFCRVLWAFLPVSGGFPCEKKSPQ